MAPVASTVPVDVPQTLPVIAPQPVSVVDSQPVSAPRSTTPCTTDESSYDEFDTDSNDIHITERKLKMKKRTKAGCAQAKEFWKHKKCDGTDAVCRKHEDRPHAELWKHIYEYHVQKNNAVFVKGKSQYPVKLVSSFPF